MKMFPHTIQGWIVFALTLIASALIAGWAMGRTDIPVGVKDILLVIVGGMVGTLTGHKMEVPPNTTISTESTIKTTGE